jgi:hypothetical protein
MLTQKNLADECVRLCTLIVTHAQIAGDAGFTDNHKALEELVREVYSEAEGLNLINTNSIQSNYPAIDLVDDANKVAIQVTNTASAAKIRQTIEKWAKAQKGDYRLRIIGIVKGGRNQKGATVTTLTKLVAKMSAMPIGRLTTVVNILKQHIAPQTYTVTTDEACVSNLLDYLDRGAIRDPDHLEGSYDKMYMSLEECKGYLISGKSEKYPIAVKPLSQYRGDIKKVLKAIEHDISRIMSICDKNRAMNETMSLQPAHATEIDNLKLEISKHLTELKKFHS